MAIKHIFVIGAGTMGNGIAQTAAVSGFQVTMMDVIPDALKRGQEAIAKSVEKLAEKGKISPQQKEAALGIGTVSDLKSVAKADLVIKAAPENPDLEFKFF